MVKLYYERGPVKLWHGDCLEWLPTLEAGSVDAVVTDPPYGVTYQSNSGVGRGTAPITNDGTRVSLRLYKRVVPFFRELPCLWFTRWDAWPDVWEIFGAATKINGLLVWDKGTPGMGDLNHWGPSYELIASCGPVKCSGSRDGSVLRFNTVPSANRNHPTEKPGDLLEYLIEKISDPSQFILDPFAGSGTTAIACIRTGRNFIGCELEEKYCEIAAKRCDRELDQGRLFTPEPKPLPVQRNLIGLEAETTTTGLE